MPLLKKKALDKVPLPEFLRDDEEVFHCEMTNEIFREYDEFADRTILCNSMVWTCSMTGKSSLTYQEAVQSEENAKKMLDDFPMELKVPLLYLATLTKRASFTDMAEDIYSYMKDRYFVGENIEASFTGNKWRDFHVLQVIAPTEQEIKKAKIKKNNDEHRFFPDATLYKYDLEQLDPDDEDISEKMMVDMTQMRRKKNQYSKEKSKLFLKQYVEQTQNRISIKETVLKLFGIDNVKFNQIFDGPLPDFNLKKTSKTTNGKKVRQETLAKFLIKNNEVDGVTKNKNNAVLIEKMKKMEAQFKQKREEMKQKSEVDRERQKMENMKIQIQLKEWYKPKEDLELEDQKPLPNGELVVCRIPDKYLGDALCIMEFLKSFSNIVKTVDYFPNGVGLDTMEKVLLDRDVDGPLIDMLQLFLDALFRLQEQETQHYRARLDGECVNDLPNLGEFNNLAPVQVTQLSNVAYRWIIKHQGIPFNKLPLCPVTVTEILRLHFLASGAQLAEAGRNWRYRQRGGYTAEDDPAIHLRIHHPNILKSLALHNIVDLPIDDKLKVLHCLVNQLLSYTDFRDVIEERLGNARDAKLNIQKVALLKKRGQLEFVKIKKGEITEAAEIDKLTILNDLKQNEYEVNIKELTKTSSDFLVVLGYDRALRRYIKLDSIPGLFINTEEENSGRCLSEPVCQYEALLDGKRKSVMHHLNTMKEEMNTSDKENEPKNAPIKLNGDVLVISDDVKVKVEPNNLNMCSADPNTCAVHAVNQNPKWTFFYKTEQVDELIESLNKRGVRENDLQQVLNDDYDSLCKSVEITPSYLLNNEKFKEPPLNIIKRSNGSRNSKRKTRTTETNLGYSGDTPTSTIMYELFLENLFEMEEKIYVGNLGGVANRDEWKQCLTDKTFNKMDTSIVKTEDIPESDDEGHSRSTSPELKFMDPGCFLGNAESTDSDRETDEALLHQNAEDKTCIKHLAIALVQLAHSIKKSVLTPPLGSRKTKGKKDHKEKKQVFDAIDNWEKSLTESSSYSQLFLHYCTLDSCVLWSRSALLAKCRICRRGTCPDQMLLCDGCNLGHHMFCLKPKLTGVPEDDWFCFKCTEERENDMKKYEVVAEKKRRIFRDEDDDEEASEGLKEDEEAVEEEEEEASDDEGADQTLAATCMDCGSGGELLNCCQENCSVAFHIECLTPPLRRFPRGPWTCPSCTANDEEEDESKEDEEEEEEEVITSAQRRSRREAEHREDLPLHNAPLQELLADVMKHDDAWPFIRPVQKNEVPDYYTVIEKPMDFGTIKYKLNMGKYNFDAEVMADAVLVFENCNTYNNSSADVYKCGVKLLKYFSKRCKELNLKTPEEMQVNDEPKSKKRRTK